MRIIIRRKTAEGIVRFIKMWSIFYIVAVLFATIVTGKIGDVADYFHFAIIVAIFAIAVAALKLMQRWWG